MDGDMINTITRVGRRFEVSTLMFPILKCACCGVVQPFHDNPDFPDKPLLPRLHFIAHPKDAYHCTGAWYKGGQFWATDCPSIMRIYCRSHGVQSNPPRNCAICDTCANEVKFDTTGLVRELYFLC